MTKPSQTPEASSRVKTVEEKIDIALANLVFSGLSIAQIDKIPKWLLENMEKNKTKFKETLHHQLQKARQDWLREEIVRFEGMKQPTIIQPEYGNDNPNYSRIVDTMLMKAHIHNQALQTIIDRYQAELDQDKK